MTWAARHRVAIWPIAWGLAGAGIFTADIFSSPRRGPLWVGVVLGLVGWSVAGAATLDRAFIRGSVVWAFAYVVAFSLGAIWSNRFEENRVAGFVGALLGWAVGASLGALLSANLTASRRQLVRPVGFAAIWGLGFFLAGYVSIVASMVLAQASKTLLAFLGDRAALTIGWTLGAMVGGALASAVGLRARDAIVGREPPAVYFKSP
jgi:hypothetical protein